MGCVLWYSVSSPAQCGGSRSCAGPGGKQWLLGRSQPLILWGGPLVWCPCEQGVVARTPALPIIWADVVPQPMMKHPKTGLGGLAGGLYWQHPHSLLKIIPPEILASCANPFFQVCVLCLQNPIFLTGRNIFCHSLHLQSPGAATGAHQVWSWVQSWTLWRQLIIHNQRPRVQVGRAVWAQGPALLDLLD